MPRSLPPQIWCKNYHPKIEITDDFLDEIQMHLFLIGRSEMQIGVGVDADSQLRFFSSARFFGTW